MKRAAVLALLLRLAVAAGMLVGATSCIDHAAPFVSRAVQVSDETMACIDTAIRASSAWSVLEQLDTDQGPMHQPEGTLYLRVPVEGAVFTPRAEFDFGNHRFTLRAFVPDDLAAWEANRVMARAQLRTVYERLRRACPALVPWSATLEDASSPPDHARTTRFLTFLFLGTAAAVLLGLLAVYVAIRIVKPPVRADDQDQRMIWHGPQ